MPSSTIAVLADAIVNSLNAAQFSQPFQATRGYLPIVDLQQLQQLKVTVVPKSASTSIASRSSSYFDYEVDVAVQKKVDADDIQAIDELMLLVEEIGDHLRFLRLNDAQEAAWVSVQNNPIVAPDHMDRMRVFTSVVTVTYRVRR